MESVVLAVVIIVPRQAKSPAAPGTNDVPVTPGTWVAPCHQVIDTSSEPALHVPGEHTSAALACAALGRVVTSGAPAAPVLTVRSPPGTQVSFAPGDSTR